MEFLSLGILIVILIFVPLIKNATRYVLTVILSIALIINLFVIILPLYKNSPDLDWFYQAQKVILISSNQNTASSTTDWFLTIHSNEIDKKIPITNGSTINEINIKSPTQIIFQAKSNDRNSKIFLQFSNWITLDINPQSVLLVSESSEKKYIILNRQSRNTTGLDDWVIPTTWETVSINEVKWSQTCLSGRQVSKAVRYVKIDQWWFVYCIPTDIQSNLTFDWNNVVQTDLNNFQWKYLVDEFQQKKMNHLIDQMWWSMILNPKIYQLNLKTLFLLYQVFPKAYSSNIANYNEFLKYIPVPQAKDVSTLNEVNSQIQNTIISQTKKWFSQTKISKRLNLFNF